MKTSLKVALVSLALASASTLGIRAQTVLPGKHVVTGDLDVGDAVTKGSLTVMGPTGTLARPGLLLEGDGGVLFSGSFGQGGIPAEGIGTRLMWYPGKGAFRVGTVSGDWWDDVEVGGSSVAFSDSRAAGVYSFAAGAANADGDYSMAFNQGEATADNAFAVGEGTSAVSYKSIVLGTFNEISGLETPDQWIASEPLFVVGNGTGETLDPPDVRFRNAFVIRKDGALELNGKINMPRQGDILMGEFGN